MMLDKEANKALDEYIKQGESWEVDLYQQAKRSERRAWIVSVVAIVLAFISTLTIASLVPLKKTEPYVVRVDKTTGHVDIINALNDSKQTYEEAVSRYFAHNYVNRRERYIPATGTEDRHFVGLYSSTPVRQQYATYTDPARNKKAPMSVYGENARVKVDIKSVSFLNDETMLIRYRKRVTRSGATTETDWAVTLIFDYTTASFSEADRQINPLGFQVLEYSNAAETL